MEREGDDLRGDVGREARESLRGQRHERLPMSLFVRREADRGDLAQVRVLSQSVGYNLYISYKLEQQNA